MFKVGDIIIINDSAEGCYTFSLPGSIGTVLEVRKEFYRVYFDNIECPSTGWTIDREHCSPYKSFYGPPENPINIKIKTMEQRWKNRCASLT